MNTRQLSSKIRPFSVLLIALIFCSAATPSVPDYSNTNHWAALPQKKDKADRVPVNTEFLNLQDSAKVDVFFIHPTTYYQSYSGNADVEDTRLNNFTDNSTITKQASVFNGVAKVYAPRYRQAALHNFFKRDGSKATKAFNLAYSDVKSAFKYYLEHYNNGRPIIIAGHSQGSMHGMKLVKEFFDGTKKQDQLIAAYLIGYNVPSNYYDFLDACDNPKESNCIISYNTFGWEAIPKYADFTNAICVNPTSWKKDQIKTGKGVHMGGVPKSFDSIDENLVECKCNNGILWITKPKENGYIMMGGKNYHMADYSLFYKDIRENLAERINSTKDAKESNE